MSDELAPNDDAPTKRDSAAPRTEITAATTVAEAFTAATELPAASRDAYLRSLAAEKPDVYQDVVSLLAYDRDDATLIRFGQVPQPKPPQPKPPQPKPPHSEPSTPTHREPSGRDTAGPQTSVETVTESSPAAQRDAFDRIEGDGVSDAGSSRLSTRNTAPIAASSSANVITADELADEGNEIERRSNRTVVVGAAADYDGPSQPRGMIQSAARMGLRTVRGRALLLGAAVASLLILGGWQLERRVEEALRRQAGDTLAVIAGEQAAGLTAWARGRSRNVEQYARDDEVLAAIVDLIAASRRVPPSELPMLPEQQRLRAALEEATGHPTQGLEDDNGLRYAVWRADRELVGDWLLDPAVYGQTESRSGAAPLTQVFGGETVAYMPQNAAYAKGVEFKLPPEVAFTAPVYDVDPRTNTRRVAAALLIGGIFQEEFGEILQGGQFGDSGETYGINANGEMISSSRFGDVFDRLGWWQVGVDGRTVGIPVHDPGVNLTESAQPPRTLSMEELARKEPTRLVDRLIGATEPVVLVDPYRDYRGVPVIGAGHWLDDLGVGTIVEVDASQAFAPLDLVKRAASIGLALLTVTALLALGFGWYTWRLERQMRSRKRMGPYILHEVIGQGGMGTVWRAEHDLLCRQTAVKVLKEEIADDLATARFEREVRLASNLQSPHTIDIYDYGRTDNGRFYCAMALLNGLTLRELVARFGLVGPSRTVHLLTQVAKSLAEAHRLGLVHRDIKPANIMVCDRGGEADWVMVLDFGLAKEVRPSRGEHITNTTMLIGTPDFIAPERIRNPSEVDPRSDLYAVGVVAFFLLTGRPCFETTGQLDALEKALYADPPSPSTLVPSAGISSSLDQLVLDLLKKKPEERIATAGELLERLEQLPVVPWTFADARRWWNERGVLAESA